MLPLIQFHFANVSHQIELSEATGHPTQLVKDHIADDTRYVISVGGDGTTGEVVNALMSLAEENRPALGLICAGSGNDAVRGFGIPTDTDVAIQTVLAGHTKSFDVGKVNDRYFASSFSIGLDANVVEQTLIYKAQKAWSGLRLYYAALLKVIVSKLKPIELTIKPSSCDGTAESIDARVLLCATTNGQTYGGGIPINPGACTASGALSFSWIDSLTVPKTLARLPLIVTGKHSNLKAYHRREITEASISSTTGERLVAQADGELFWDTHFEVSTLPAQLQVLVPEKP